MCCVLCAVLICPVVSDSFVTPWTAARQAPLSMGFPRQEYWSGLPCPPPGDLLSSGIESRSPALQADSVGTQPPGKIPYIYIYIHTYTYVLIYDIWFSLSDFICMTDSGSSTSLPMTQFHSFLWLSNIPLCVCIYLTTSLCIHLLIDI